MRRSTLIACALIVSFHGVACGDTGSDKTSGSAPPDREALRDAVAHAICGNAGPCCERGGLHVKEACEARVRPIYSSEFGTDASTYDPALGSECLELITAEIRACSVRDSFGTGDACERLSRGPDGAHTPGKAGDACDATCTSSGGIMDCGLPSRAAQSGEQPHACHDVDGLYCDENSQCSNLLPIGSPCTSLSKCASGYCASATEKCTAWAAEGETCSNFEGCTAGLGCVDSGGGPRCKHLLEDGAACTADEQCAGGPCVNAHCGTLSPFFMTTCGP